MAVDPTGEALHAFVAASPDEPLVMLNLLRFVDGGWASYAQYSQGVAEILRRHGGQVLYFGQGQPALVADDGQAWDAVLLVQYPSRQAFGTMVADPDYQRFTQLRTSALQEAVLQPTRSLL